MEFGLNQAFESMEYRKICKHVGAVFSYLINFGTDLAKNSGLLRR